MLNKNQEKLLKELRKGNNVFIAGEAGTGKTYVLNKYIDECKEKGKNVIITAPTGIAALNLSGQTMHSAFLIPIPAYGHYDFDIKLSKIKPITIADVIIIDEISMCRVDVFEYFYLIIKKIKDETNNYKFCNLNHPTDGIKKHIGTLGKQVCRGTLYAFQCYALLNLKIIYTVRSAITSNS